MNFLRSFMVSVTSFFSGSSGLAADEESSDFFASVAGRLRSSAAILAEARRASTKVAERAICASR